MNESDRLAIAGEPVPDELTPLAQCHASSLPQQERTENGEMPFMYARYRTTPDPQVGDLVRECRRPTHEQIASLTAFAESLV